MTTFTPHRDTVEAFVDCMHGGADEEVLFGILAENVVLYGPLGDEPLTGRGLLEDVCERTGLARAVAPANLAFSRARRTASVDASINVDRSNVMRQLMGLHRTHRPRDSDRDALTMTSAVAGAAGLPSPAGG